MTLVLTELNQHGIAMAADSAVTFSVPLPSGGVTHRVLHGVRKLQPIHHINAGISCWGLGSINGVDTDIWIADLIQRSQSVTSDLHSHPKISLPNYHRCKKGDFVRLFIKRIALGDAQNIVIANGKRDYATARNDLFLRDVDQNHQIFSPRSSCRIPVEMADAPTPQYRSLPPSNPAS